MSKILHDPGGKSVSIIWGRAEGEKIGWSNLVLNGSGEFERNGPGYTDLDVAVLAHERWPSARAKTRAGGGESEERKILKQPYLHRPPPLEHQSSAVIVGQ